MSSTHSARQDPVLDGEAIVLESDRADGALQQLPRLNFVEQFEQQNAEEHFARRPWEVLAINHIPNKILADAIGCAVRVGELVDRQHGVVCPGARCAPYATKE